MGWLARRRERKTHNDRDPECRYWWGDRSGYTLIEQRCAMCRVEEAEPVKETVLEAIARVEREYEAWFDERVDLARREADGERVRSNEWADSDYEAVVLLEEMSAALAKARLKIAVMDALETARKEVSR